MAEHRTRPPTRETIYQAIDAERHRQHTLWDRPHEWGYGDCSSPEVDYPLKVVVLTEEVGEVARAVLNLDDDNLRTELIQVAAVAVAMLEGLNQ